MPHTIGLDVGTTGAKGLLVDQTGKVVASAASAYPIHTPKPLWSEQDPEDWWKATQRVIRVLLQHSSSSVGAPLASGILSREVVGIGLTGQMHGLVLLDGSGKVLRPCIMWNDQRTALQCEEITTAIGFSKLMKVTGNPVLPGFTAPKLLWIRENEPNVYRKIAHVLLPKDYIRYKLTGEFATDVSDASGTSLLDVLHRCWSNELLNELQIPTAWMPTLYESTGVSGRISADAAAATGLRAGTPVVAGAGDQAAGGIGTGIVEPGVVSVTIGTSGVVFAHSDKLLTEPEGRLHAFCHAVPGAWHLMGVTLAAGGSLRWFRDVLGEPERVLARSRGVDPYEILMEEAAKAPAGSEGLFFLPYLSGERTPYPDPNARGAFVGLTLRHTKSHMVRSVLEGVAFSLRDCLELIKGIGLRIEQVRASGGGARSAHWRQILADVLNKEVVTVTSTEGASFGAALLAGVGTGVFTDLKSACNLTIRPTSRTAPDRDCSELYERCYQLYRSLYPALSPTFKSVTDIQPIAQ
jgi:xylulokinase